jgi:serine/threonine protein kinase
MQIGDPRYVPLEILCGILCDERKYYSADIFSLGAILFELFTRTNLTTIIFSSLEINTAINVLNTALERDRADIFDNIVGSISNKLSLPNIRSLDPTIPKSIAYVIDELYKSLASIDYRDRRTDFQIIFSKINLCEKHIRYYKKYEAWKLKKRTN